MMYRVTVTDAHGSSAYVDWVANTSNDAIVGALTDYDARGVLTWFPFVGHVVRVEVEERDEA